MKKHMLGWMVVTLALAVGMLAGTAEAQTTYTWTQTVGILASTMLPVGATFCVSASRLRTADMTTAMKQ